MNLQRRFWLILVVLWAYSNITAQQPTELHLRGIVTDDKTRRPVPGAHVSIVGGEARYSDTTDAKGVFDLRLGPSVHPGDSIRLRVEKADYASSDENVIAGDQIPHQISIVPNSALAPKITPKSTVVPAPEVTASCQLSDAQSPCELYCSIENGGTDPAHDVSVGFTGMLPVQTRLSAEPDVRARLEKSDTLPVPDPKGTMWKAMEAFVVRVPVIPPRSTLPFALWTEDGNNRKACDQATFSLPSSPASSFANRFSCI
jgi:hypothetical protein